MVRENEVWERRDGRREEREREDLGRELPNNPVHAYQGRITFFRVRETCTESVSLQVR